MPSAEIDDRKTAHSYGAGTIDVAALVVGPAKHDGIRPYRGLEARVCRRYVFRTALPAAFPHSASNAACASERPRPLGWRSSGQKSSKYLELVPELQALGNTFRTKSHTKVIVH